MVLHAVTSRKHQLLTCRALPAFVTSLDCPDTHCASADKLATEGLPRPAQNLPPVNRSGTFEMLPVTESRETSKPTSRPDVESTTHVQERRRRSRTSFSYLTPAVAFFFREVGQTGLTNDMRALQVPR